MAPRSLLDELLSGATPSGFAPEDVERARALAHDPTSAKAEQVEALPAPLAEAILLATVRARLPGLAETLTGSKNKALAKLAKKALYQLRSGGVEVAAKRAQEASPPALPSPAAGEFPCFLSPVNGAGERAVLLHQASGSRIETLYLVMSDEHGAVQALLGESTRSKFTKMVRMLRQENRADIEIPLEEARRIVAEAAALNLATRSPYPEGMLEALRHFDIPPAATPFEVPPPEEDDARLSMEGHTLHEQPEIASWMPSEPELKVLVQKLAAIEDSPLQLTPLQRTEQLRQTLRQHARASFTPQVRNVYSRRLWTMGDYFERTGRAHLAEVARAEARRLAHDVSEPFSRFAEAMFEKVLRLMATPAGQAAADRARGDSHHEAPKSGLILSP